MKAGDIMKKLIAILTAALMLTAILCGCGSEPSASVSSGVSSAENVSGGLPSDQTSDGVYADPADAEDAKTDITDAFAVYGDAAGYSVSGGVYTFTAAGEYTLSGKLDGQIVVNAGDEDEVTLVLNGASLNSSTVAPVYVENADKVTILAADGTYNEVIDTRTAQTAVEESEDGDATGGAIYSKDDLLVCGTGALYVSGGYNNGIHSGDDLKVSELTLKVVAPNNALKGNDSVTVESGSVIAISTGGDGIKTKNTDVSEKGNQRGTVEIKGGSVNIYAACDGIDAAYDALISGSAVVKIFTDSQSDHTGSVVASAGEDFYVVVPASAYNGYRYAVYYYNDDGGVWADAEYDTMVSSGRTRYYGLLASAPSGYASMAIYRFAEGASDSLDSYDAKTEGEAVNESMNAYLIESVSSGAMDGEWVNLTSGSSNSEKSEHSAKGVKAANEIVVSGGAVIVNCDDDGLHANGGDKLDNGSTGAGNITISGGEVVVSAADDGIHADNIININGGYIHIPKSHEGIEANVMNFNGGSVYVYANDDGLNACKGSATPLINITGGYIDVATPSGDTDGVDSNGNITISGGFMLVKCGSSQGMMAGSVDLDGTLTATGGTIVALGGICETPSGSSTNFTVTMNRVSFAAGSYSVKTAAGEELFSFELESGYSSAWITSDQFASGGAYKLVKDGSDFTSWTQSSRTVSV